jgi:hypothetical protein
VRIIHIIMPVMSLREDLTTIAADARYVYDYARDVIKRRFELGEPVIATNVYYSYHYARDVIKGRFELGEPAIAADANYTYGI